MAAKMNRIDGGIVMGGLLIVLITAVLFAMFPLYQLLDSSSVRRPFWNPPSIVVREPGQGLAVEDIARLDQDPRQRELIQGLKEGIIYQPSPSWLGRQ